MKHSVMDIRNLGLEGGELNAVMSNDLGVCSFPQTDQRACDEASATSPVEPPASEKDTLMDICTSDDSGLGSPGSGEDEVRPPVENKRPTRSCTRQARKYDLRESSVINRIQTERRRSEPRQPKPKVRPPPLSKYRRRSANSRERSRMKDINDAFDVLRRVVPPLPPTARLAPGTKVPTKITTLRLAMNYIAALRDMLGYDAIVMPDVLPALATNSPHETEPCSPEQVRLSNIQPSGLPQSDLPSAITPDVNSGTLRLPPCHELIQKASKSIFTLPTASSSPCSLTPSNQVTS